VPQNDDRRPRHIADWGHREIRHPVRGRPGQRESSSRHDRGDRAHLDERPWHAECGEAIPVPSGWSGVRPSSTGFGLAGDVLVCPITSPVWSVLFPSIGALVTDTGGILSHPAIIAREYDTSAMVATENRTLVLPDGQLVTVDGASGIVQVAMRTTNARRRRPGTSGAYRSFWSGVASRAALAITLHRTQSSRPVSSGKCTRVHAHGRRRISQRRQPLR
jgi:phosphohistidine swiveling domain-containing protein